ncbi:hypothetical protein [Verrucomicrobium sp. GAS474]|uniref:hypothetical protein n=1 Tax=Verrucomicrobium sp. GAS474 TaxID=1882831 RepID=UPI000B869A24|nr:hypothetical protein [Verrucomicrobium sp. GAS474]
MKTLMKSVWFSLKHLLLVLIACTASAAFAATDGDAAPSQAAAAASTSTSSGSGSTQFTTRTIPEKTPDTGAPELFSLRLVQESLVIADMNHKDLATIVPETIATLVRVGPYAFTITYGRNPSGDLIAILTADLANPKGLSFSVNGRHIELGASTSQAMASITIILSSVTKLEERETDDLPTITPLSANDPVQNLDVSKIGTSYTPPAALPGSPVPPFTPFSPFKKVAINLNPLATTPF